MDTADFNCKFCYCPLFFMRDCGGTYVLTDGKKDCSMCVIPHQPDNTPMLLDKLSDVVERIGVGYEL